MAKTPVYRRVQHVLDTVLCKRVAISGIADRLLPETKDVHVQVKQ